MEKGLFGLLGFRLHKSHPRENGGNVLISHNGVATDLPTIQGFDHE